MLCGWPMGLEEVGTLMTIMCAPAPFTRDSI
jgi:hypothetical protein